MMCYCNPHIRTIYCNSLECRNAEGIAGSGNPKIDYVTANVKKLSRVRSQEMLSELKGDMSFDDLIAAIYFQGWKDSGALENTGKIK